MNRRAFWSLVLPCLLACQATPGATPGVSAAVEVVALRVLDAPEDMPRGTDAVHPLRHQLVVGSRSRQLPPALFAALQGQTAVVWLPDHRLARFAIEGAPRLIARSVSSPPWVGDDRVVFAPEVGDTVHVRALSQGVETTLARGLASAGMFRLGPDAQSVFFLGAHNGGVAGLWLARFDAEPARCLTNCELRTGQRWGDAFVPPPGTAESLAFAGDSVSYVAMNGQAVTRSFR